MRGLAPEEWGGRNFVRRLPGGHRKHDPVKRHAKPRASRRLPLFQAHGPAAEQREEAVTADDIGKVDAEKRLLRKADSQPFAAAEKPDRAQDEDGKQRMGERREKHAARRQQQRRHAGKSHLVEERARPAHMDQHGLQPTLEPA